MSDVIVVGAGNAGFTAAHAAASRGRSVLLLEKAPETESGGNSYYTAGATRIAHNGLEDLRTWVDPDERHEVTDVPVYTEADYEADLVKVTEGRNDPELTRVLVSEAAPTIKWLASLGLRYRLMYERQAYERADGSFLFWGGLHVGNTGGGEGLIADHRAVADRLGIEVRYSVRVTELLREDGKIVGVLADGPDGPQELRAESVVMTAGGFEANAQWREKHLGAGWQHAKVRGNPHNTGDLIAAALDIGAAPGGDWTTCHSVQWDAFLPDNESNRELTNRLTRQSYHLGILVNNDGHRFLDEGADFRNLTYAKYGSKVLAQPGSVAYQVFDATLRPLLRTEEYDMPGVSVLQADTLDGLAAKMGIDPAEFVRTVTEFNASIDETRPLDLNVKDGRSAGVVPPKSNWASPMETAPFFAYGVTCGITFTFGGVKTDTHGRVLDESGAVIPGLFAAGEMLGGLFSGNYPGGSGLAAGSVFGRRAGSLA